MPECRFIDDGLIIYYCYKTFEQKRVIYQKIQLEISMALLLMNADTYFQ